MQLLWIGQVARTVSQEFYESMVQPDGFAAKFTQRVSEQGVSITHPVLQRQSAYEDAQLPHERRRRRYQQVLGGQRRRAQSTEGDRQLAHERRRRRF